MPSAFISYAHEDQEFVLLLAEQLRAAGLDVRFDQVVLHVGDSLIETISREIVAGDFLIAVVSPDSVESGWCRIELEIAITHGINEQRVKVLPVRYREAVIPPFLVGRYWADADRNGVDGVAQQLIVAIETHLVNPDVEDVGEEVAEALADEAEPAARVPVQQQTVADVDTLAERVFDVLARWDECRQGVLTHTLADAQRRLRYALDALPERVRAGLPLVAQIAVRDWNDYFRVIAPDQVEPDLREELRSVRAQITQGLPVTARWRVAMGLGEVGTEGRDARAFLWGIERDDEDRRITVYISRTALASSDEHLPREVVEAKRTEGRSVVVSLLPLGDPPRRVMVSTAGVSWPVED